MYVALTLCIMIYSLTFGQYAVRNVGANGWRLPSKMVARKQHLS